MGQDHGNITRFSGPVYGAKACLAAGAGVGTSGASTIYVASLVVPPYETWYLTEFGASASSNSSNANIKLKVKGTSTSASYPGPGPDPLYPTGNASTGVVNVTFGASTVASAIFGTITSTPGEYEGYAAPANSSIRVVSTAVNPIAGLNWRIMGFIRYLDSTRAV